MDKNSHARETNPPGDGAVRWEHVYLAADDPDYWATTNHDMALWLCRRGAQLADWRWRYGGRPPTYPERRAGLDLLGPWSLYCKAGFWVFIRTYTLPYMITAWLEGPDKREYALKRFGALLSAAKRVGTGLDQSVLSLDLDMAGGGADDEPFDLYHMLSGDFGQPGDAWYKGHEDHGEPGHPDPFPEGWDPEAEALPKHPHLPQFDPAVEGEGVYLTNLLVRIMRYWPAEREAAWWFKLRLFPNRHDKWLPADVRGQPEPDKRLLSDMQAFFQKKAGLRRRGRPRKGATPAESSEGSAREDLRALYQYQRPWDEDLDQEKENPVADEHTAAEVCAGKVRRFWEREAARQRGRDRENAGCTVVYLSPEQHRAMRDAYFQSEEFADFLAKTGEAHTRTCPICLRAKEVG